MQTSYFANPKLKLIDQNRLVSIVFKTPIKNILVYKSLCPSIELIKIYKSGLINFDEYTRIYTQNVLNKLNPRIVYEQIGSNKILLCYEKSRQFCHRRLIAEWFEKYLNISVLEL